MTNAKAVLVNGKKYEVANVGTMTVTLVGPRGGAVSMIQNIHSGRWYVITGGMKPRSIPVETLEVVA